MLKSHLKTLSGFCKFLTSTRPFPIRLLHTGSFQLPNPSEQKPVKDISYTSPLDYFGLGPLRFNSNFQDITPNNVRIDFSKDLNIRYLSNVDDEEPFPQEVNGRMFGIDARPIVSLIVQKKGTHVRKYVHFILDTTSPYSYMTDEVFQAFDEEDMIAHYTINGEYAPLYRSRADFRHVNILGMDYLTAHNIDLIMKAGKSKFVLKYSK